MSTFDICVIGGAGHVGLPLALVFACQGKKVLIYDINTSVLNTIRSGQMPHMEKGAEPMLKSALENNALVLTDKIAEIAQASTIIVTIGTPVDEFMNPSFKMIKDCIDSLLPYLCDGQLLILRSTVYPGTTKWLARYLQSKYKNIAVAFCPERVVQGQAIEELQNLPQIISGVTPEAESRADKLFSTVAKEVVVLSPMEAEFAKLFLNAYRYIQFAVSNQFYMFANSAGVDYHRVFEGMKKDYPRAANIPKPGFAAGPCLLKDTMQLSAFSNNQFSLGESAMLVNEGLVLYLVNEIEKQHELEKLNVGLLGMAFKANSDDIRSSLSYKLKKILQIRCNQVYTTDPHVVVDPELLPLNEVIDKSDLLILCAPHSAYRDLNLRGKPIVDIWGFSKDWPQSFEPNIVMSNAMAYVGS
jgi:UDP-N-acetyl-D-mannosaminuronic acid dehydrogenase